MAKVLFPGAEGPWVPYPLSRDYDVGAGALATLAILDASGEKLHCIGNFIHQDRGSKTITKIHAYFSAKVGTVSTVRASIQALDLTTGPPGRGDGTLIDSGTLSMGGITAGAFNAFTLAGSTVTHGDRIVVVIDYSAFTASESMTLQGVDGAGQQYSAGFAATNTSGSYAAVVTARPNILLECSDGTFGTIDSSFPATAITQVTVNTGTSPDEVGMKFRFPAAASIDGLWAQMRVISGSDFDFVIYRDTTVLGTISIDANTWAILTDSRAGLITFPELQLLANTDYIVAFKPTTANSQLLWYFNVGAAAHLQAHPCGTEWHWVERTDAGAWSSITTRRPMMGIKLSSLDTGVGRANYQLGVA